MNVLCKIFQQTLFLSNLRLHTKCLYIKELGTSEKKPDTVIILLQKDKKMETADTQNSTFANHTSRPTTKICKRAVFLLTHAHN
jgi:hypothetical protein